jgi:hypothetical protein
MTLAGEALPSVMCKVAHHALAKLADLPSRSPSWD